MYAARSLSCAVVNTPAKKRISLTPEMPEDIFAAVVPFLILFWLSVGLGPWQVPAPHDSWPGTKTAV
jgi:hypothetical protein